MKPIIWILIIAVTAYALYTWNNVSSANSQASAGNNAINSGIGDAIGSIGNSLSGLFS